MKVTKSIKIDPELWIKVKIQSTRDNTSISEYISQCLERELKK